MVNSDTQAVLKGSSGQIFYSSKLFVTWLYTTSATSMSPAIYGVIRMEAEKQTKFVCIRLGNVQIKRERSVLDVKQPQWSAEK